MQSLHDVQKAFYAPRQGPPMLPPLLPPPSNPLRRNRKRRKLAKRHIPIPHRPKDVLPANFSASQLPEGFPPELAFRALAAYALLRTLSCELRLSPFTPNVFLRALYLPFPSKLIGQVHASLLRILLASLNMGYSCKPKGNNIPDVIRKKRRVDGIRWPLRAGDNLTFLDNFTWPLFYDDYVHLTADILWATMNSEENHGDFRNIGMPDLTGMILEEDLREQEEEQSLMAKPARISNTLAMHDKSPYALDALSRSSRSARRAKVSYSINVESDDESYDEEAVLEEEANDDEEEEEYMDKRKGNSKKRGRSNKRSLPKSTTAKLPTQKQTPSPYSNASIHARGTNSVSNFKVANGSNQRKKQTKQAPKGKSAIPTPAPSKAKKTNRMLPSSRTKKKSPPPTSEVETKTRSPGAGRKLPTQGSKSRSPPSKKPKRSPFSGSKVEWVEEGPSPSHFGGRNNANVRESSKSLPGILPAPQPRRAKASSAPVKTPTPTPTVTVPTTAQLTRVPQVTAMPAIPGTMQGISGMLAAAVPGLAAIPGPGVPGLSVSPFVGQHLLNQNSHILQQYNATLQARAYLAQQVQSTSAAYFPSGLSVGHNHDILSAPIHNPPINTQHSGKSGLPLHSAEQTDSAGRHTVSKEVASVLRDFIGGRLFNNEAREVPNSSTMEIVEVNDEAEKTTAMEFEKSDQERRVNFKGDNATSTSAVDRNTAADHSKGTPRVTMEGVTIKAAKGDQTLTSVELNDEFKVEKGDGRSPVPTAGMDVDEASMLSTEPTMLATTDGEPLMASRSTNTGVEHGNQDAHSLVGGDSAGTTPFDFALNLGGAPASESASNLGMMQSENATARNDDNNIRKLHGTLNGHQCNQMPKNGDWKDTAIGGLPESWEPSSISAQEAKATESVPAFLIQSAALATSEKAASKMAANHANEVVHSGASQSSAKVPAKIPNAVVSDSAVSAAMKSEHEVSPHIAASSTEPMEDAKQGTTPAPSAEQQSANQKGLESPSDKAQQKVNTVDDISVTSEQSESSLPFADDEDQWPQFQPIRSMRAGLPYHRLPLEEKLAVLEFLIDELLSMGTFASVFTQRRIAHLYDASLGALPSKAEFDELENEDECAVCKGEGELLCCDGCVSSYHRSCIDMRPNEVLPEGRWLCPECELIDPAKYGSLRGGRKSTLDWFTVDDIHAAIRLKHASEQNTLTNPVTLDGTAPIHNSGLTNTTMSNPSSTHLAQPNASSGNVGNTSLNPAAALLQQRTNPLGLGINGANPGQDGVVGSQNECNVAAGKSSATGVESTFNATNSPETTVAENALTRINGIGPTRSHSTVEEYLVVHGFVFARSRRVGHDERQSSNNDVTSSSSYLEPLSQTQLFQLLKSIGPDMSLAWPLAQIPFTTLDESGAPVPRGIVHPKVLAFDTKATFDPTAYASKYRKTPLAKSAFPGANFHSIQLLLSDYEYVCNTCNLKRLSDRLSPDMSTDRILAQSLRAEANLFDPYQLIRDYMLKLENLLNRAHLLNEFWGTRNKEIKAHVWQMNVRNCRSIPRLAKLLLMLIDACHRRAFTEQWFVISGNKQEEHLLDEVPTTESRTLHPLPSDWTLEAEKRKRKWERSSLADVLSLLAEERRDVEQWVYGEGNAAKPRKKRKQAVTGRSPYSPNRTLVSSKDSKKFVVDEMSMNKVALSKRDIAGLVEKEKKKPTELDAPGVLSIQVLQQAIDRRVTTGIPNEREKGEVSSSQDETAGKPSASTSATSRRSRRSGRLQTKKESPEDFIANVIAESGKAQKDLSMATLIEAQEMSKLVEIKELSAVPFGGTGHWPVAGRLLFDPVGSLCRAEMRRLGRNAGRAMAQHISYTGSYEVGEVSHFHVWRKNMQKCLSYEQLLLLIRALESNLDKPTITSCEALARRTPHARSQVSKAVKCTQRDPMTGIDHHFILQKNKNRGNWVSSLALELSPFMVERSERREKQQEAFSKKLREKSMEEARAREAARLKAAAEAAARTQALMREQAAARAKAAKEQAEAKAKALREKAEAKAAAKAAKAAQKAKEKAEKAAAKAKLKAERDAAREASKQAARAKLVQPPSSSMSQQAQNVVGIQNDVQRVLAAHKMATQQLIRESSNAGLSFVPEAEIKRLRMRAAADLQNCYRGVQINSDTLFSQLGKAESDALKAETEAKKAAVDKRLQNMSGGTETQTTNKETPQAWNQPKQSMRGSSEQATNNGDLPLRRSPPTAPLYPSPAPTASAMQNPTLSKTTATSTAMRQPALGQHAGNPDPSNHQSSNQSKSRANPSTSFSRTPMQSSESRGHVGAYAAAPPGQYPSHGNGYNPNPTGFFPAQSQRASAPQSAGAPREVGGAPGLVGGYAAGAASQKSQAQRTDWGGNPQLLPNQLLHALGGESGKQQSLPGMNHQLRGNGNAWNLARSAQEARGRENSRESQMAELARLANGGSNLQHLIHSRPSGGIPSHHQAANNVRAPGSTSHYQELVRGTDYRTALPPSNNRLQNAMNRFSGGQFYQGAAPSGSRPVFPGYNNPNSMYGAQASGFRPDYAGREDRRSAQPQQALDFEPTPIAELTQGTHHAPQPSNAYNPNAYPQPQHHQQQQQQQHPHQNQWFQR